MTNDVKERVLKLKKMFDVDVNDIEKQNPEPGKKFDPAEIFEAAMKFSIDLFYPAKGGRTDAGQSTNKEAEYVDPKALFDLVVPKELNKSGLAYEIDVAAEAIDYSRTAFYQPSKDYMVYKYDGKYFVAGTIYSDHITGSDEDDLFFSSAGVSGGIDVIETGAGRDILAMCPFMNQRIITDFDLANDVIGVTSMFGRNSNIKLADTIVDGKESLAIVFEKPAMSANLRDHISPVPQNNELLQLQKQILGDYDHTDTEIVTEQGEVTSLNQTGGFVLVGITKEEFLEAAEARGNDMLKAFSYAGASFVTTSKRQTIQPSQTFVQADGESNGANDNTSESPDNYLGIQADNLTDVTIWDQDGALLRSIEAAGVTTQQNVNQTQSGVYLLQADGNLVAPSA